MFPAGCTNGGGQKSTVILPFLKKFNQTQEPIDAKIRGETHLVIVFHFFF